MAQIKTKKADLKSKYNVYVEFSLIISLILLIAAFKFAPKAVKPKLIDKTPDDIIKVENIQNTLQEVSKPKEPKPPVPILSFIDEIEDITFQQTDIFNNDVVTLPEPPINTSRIIEDEDIIFEVVEDYPELIGGVKSLQEKLYYTEIAKRIGIEGKVIVSAVIDKNGDVIETSIYKSLIDDLDKIALKAVNELKFKPGKQRGKPVKVQINIPIYFKLK